MQEGLALWKQFFLRLINLEGPSASMKESIIKLVARNPQYCCQASPFEQVELLFLLLNLSYF